MNLPGQSQFRNAVHLRDKNCLVTKFNECECDACHIIPYAICDKNTYPFLFDRRNGLFLTKSLHALFDRFYWTFDIYDIRMESNRYMCRLLVSPNQKKLSINNYRGQYIPIPLECFPFLYVHYQIFIAYNYDSSINISNVYNEIIKEDAVFHYLYQNNLPIESLLKKNFKNFLIKNGIIKMNNNEEFFVNAIIKHKETSNQDYYFIWWDHLPYSESSWEPKKHLKKYSIESYFQQVEEMDDHSYL